MLNIDHMRRIAAALGVTPGDLLNDADNPFRLKSDEMELVARLRMAADAERDQLRRVADVMLPWHGPEPKTGTND